MPNKSPISLTVMPSMVSLSAKKSQYISVVGIDKTSNASVVCNSRGEHTMTINIKGYDVLIDDEDYALIQGYTWYLTGNGYIMGYKKGTWTKEGVNYILFHRLIMNAPKGKCVDHQNGNVLDNRKQNLRICEPIDNSRNRRIGKNNTTGYVGVFYHNRKKVKKYQAKIMVNKKNISLGYYLTAEAASEAYKNAAKLYFGDYYREPTEYFHKTPYHEDGASKHKGFTFNKRSNKYVAKIQINGEVIYLGTFNNAEDAAQAYNIAILKIAKNKDMIDVYEILKGQKKRERNPEICGVSINKNTGKYTARIRYNKKEYCIGSFDTRNDARMAYVITKNFLSKSNEKDDTKIKEIISKIEIKRPEKYYKTGVKIEKGSGKYIARITNEHKVYYLGRFNTLEEARQAYIQAKERFAKVGTKRC
jgi:hypothetical protein